MDTDPELSFRERFNTVSLFLRDRLTQLSAIGNLQFQKYYDKLLDSVQAYHEIILDENGTILTWNNRFQKLEGYCENEIIGQNFNLFYLPGERQRKLPEDLLRDASLHGKSHYFGQFVKKGGGMFWANIILTAIKKNNIEVLGYIVLCKEVAAH